MKIELARNKMKSTQKQTSKDVKIKFNIYIYIHTPHTHIHIYIYIYIYTGWPTKMSLFIFGDNVYKNKDTFSQTAFQVPPSENSQAG